MSSRWKRYTIGFKSREKPKSPLVQSRKQDDVRSLQGRHSVSCDRVEYKSKNMGDQMVFGEPGAASNHAVFEDAEYCKESFAHLYDLHKQKILCDVTLEVGTKSIQCHRVVLACCSQYFHAMFCTDMAESHMEVIPIKDIDQSAMEQLIEFAYTARILLTVDNVQQIFYAASILQLDSVCNACCSFMMSHLHPNNCLGMRVFAERHNHQALLQAADRYTMDYFPEVVQSEEFCTMTETNLLRLIQADELNVSSEMEVYEAVMKWVKSDVDNRKDSLSMLISKVRLPLLPATYLMHQVETEELLKKDLTCRDLLDEAKYYQLSLTGIVPCARVTDRTKFRKSYAGVIFCMGGRGNSMDPLESVECYDLRRNIWLPVTEMMTKRRHVGAACAGGRFFIRSFGMDTCIIFKWN